MEIIIATKQLIENTPPLEAVATTLAQLGHEVHIVNYSSTSQARQRLKTSGITTVSFCKKKWPITSWGKIKCTLPFRIFLNKFLTTHDCDLLWLCNPDIIPFVNKVHFQNRIILHTLELYDNLPRYHKYIKQVENIGGTVIVPDLTRSYILKTILGLKNTPYVIHNKPVQHPRSKKMDSKFTNLLPKKILTQDKALILYQGHIGRDRPILEVAKAVREFDNLILIAMGGGQDIRLISELKALGGIHIEYIPAPQHLNITSWAKIGIISYNYKNLNNLFCAPNKIFEYSGFGIPFISSYHPNLSSYAEGFSCPCKELNPLNIKNAIQQILSNYEIYSTNAKTFYDSINIKEELLLALGN